MAAPFISRTDLSDYLGRDLTADDKALQCVDAACDMCRTVAEQNFNAVEDDTVVLDGSGTDALLLPQLPVSAVDTVSYVTYTDGVPEEEELEDYVLNGHGVLLRTDGAVWRKGRQNYTVSYAHGYATEDLPRDVRMVALQMAARLFKQASGAVYETLGAYSVRYAGAPLEFTKSELAILRKYRQTK